MRRMGIMENYGTSDSRPSQPIFQPIPANLISRLFFAAPQLFVSGGLSSIQRGFRDHHLSSQESTQPHVP
jgi:hypothetical protein